MALVGGATAGWPLVPRAQKPERMRRVGVLMSLPADDPRTSPPYGIFAGITGIGLERRPQRDRRYPLVYWQ